MKTAEEILHEKHREIDGWKSWLIIEAMEEYADQFKQPTKVMPSDEEIEKEEICSCNLYCTANNGFIAPLCRNNGDCVFKESHLKPAEKEEKNLKAKIKKYNKVLETLQQNKQFKSSEDNYPYDLDIKLTKEVLKDLNECLIEE